MHFLYHKLNKKLTSNIKGISCLLIIMATLIFLSACQPEVSLEPEVTAEEPVGIPSETATQSAVTPEPELIGDVPAFYLGVDLSYVNEMDDCGAVYLENGIAQDAFQLFSRHGASLVRARLWHNPDWTDYSTVPDITKTFRRAKEAGMATLLDFHYSDNWADPGKQAIPAAWQGMDEDELVEAVYDYTYDVLMELHENGLMPRFVQVGNETNSGMLKQVAALDWPRDARLFNAGIKAVRDAAKETNTNPKIILHVAQPENAGWWFQNAIENGITDFDVIGLSYYPQWSSFSVSDVGGQVTYLRQKFDKDVMIVETAYLWTLDAADETASNILNKGVRGYPFTVEGQRQFMIDLSQNLISNGALGVVYWEPAWVSTPCSTRWGQGSHWENATFFDFKNNNEVHAGIEFLSFDYEYPTQLMDGVIEKDYGEPILVDEEGDNLEQVPHLDLLSLYTMDMGDSVSIGLSIAGEIYDDPWGGYFVYLDTTQDSSGANVDVGKRPITVADPYKPEFRLDIFAIDRKGTISGSYELHAWDGIEWELITMTGGLAIQNGVPSIIEIQLPKALLGNPEFLNIGIISVGRGRVHTAGDLMGSSPSPADWNEDVMLRDFAQLIFSQ